jgi:DNA-nicking Smr family endonuclease
VDKGKPTRPDIIQDDASLFRQSMADARPLKREAEPPSRPKPPAKARFRRADEARVLIDSLDLGHGPEILDNGDHLNFRRPEVSGLVLKKLQRGKYRLQAEVDLHGLTVVQARDELAGFLKECRQEHLSCVRVIHGKGLGSGNKGPVLKSKVALWLKQSDLVLAYTSARPVDGGTGALYVLLQRKR